MMESKTKSLLLPFYFGSIKDQDRMLVERELLSDSEMLIDYLDLKRSLEHAPMVPQQPSTALYQRLLPKTSKRKLVFWVASFGAAAAAAIVAVFFMSSNPSSTKTPAHLNEHKEILFDSNSELSINSNVL
jgi:hypothetical protein